MSADLHASPPAPSVRAGVRWWRLLEVPGVWLACLAVLTIRGPHLGQLLATKPFFNWDSSNYANLALHPPTFRACTWFGGVDGWCGTAGWLPGYPWAIRAFYELHLTNLYGSARIVSWLGLLAFFLVAWIGWTRKMEPWRSVLVLAGLGLFPGAIYLYAAFPLSLSLALSLGAVLAASRGRLLLAGLAAFAACFCYITAAVALASAAVLGLVLALACGDRLARRAAIAIGAGVLAGLLGLAVYFQLAVHRWNAYLLIQSQWKALPGSLYLRSISFKSNPASYFLGRHGHVLVFAQTALFTGLVLLACALAWRGWREGRRDFTQLAPVAMGLGVLLALVLSPRPAASMFTRSALSAAPLVLGLSRLPAWGLGLVVVASGVVASEMAHYWFIGNLV